MASAFVQQTLNMVERFPTDLFNKMRVRENDSTSVRVKNEGTKQTFNPK